MGVRIQFERWAKVKDLKRAAEESNWPTLYLHPDDKPDTVRVRCTIETV